MDSSAGERLGIGRGAEVFAWGDGRVIKLLRDPANAPWLEREFVAQRAAASAGVSAPDPIEITHHDGRPGLVMERASGVDGLTVLDRQPWRVWEIGSRVGRLHRSLASVEAPAEIPSLLDEVRHDLTVSGRIPEAARARVLPLLALLPDMPGLCHMDFHPANVMFGGPEPVVIDFASTRRGDPVADHAKSLILLEASSPPEADLWQRLLVRVGRRLLRIAYRRGYGRLSVDEAARAEVWRAVLIAQRLAEGIREERRALLKMLGPSLRAAESAR